MVYPDAPDRLNKKEGVSKQSNWHILFLFCFVFQKSFKPPILD